MTHELSAERGEARPFFEWKASRDGRVLQIDQGWAEFAGLTGDGSTLGEGWRALFSPADVARLTAAAARAQDERRMFVLEASILQPEQAPKLVVICGVPTPQGAAGVGFAGVTIPIQPVLPPAVVSSCVMCGDLEDEGGHWVPVTQAVLARWHLQPSTCPRCRDADRRDAPARPAPGE